MNYFLGLGPVQLTYVLFELTMKNRPAIKVPEDVHIIEYNAGKDAELLAMLHNRTMSQCEDFSPMDAEFFKKIPKHTSFVAEIDGYPVGMAITAVANIENCRQGYIAELGVLKNYRYRGVGSALLKRVLDFFESEKVEKVTCEVLESNIETMYILKRKACFVEVGRVTYVTSQIPMRQFMEH
ncbi:MAG: GNAT family N-acetyltransferase [Candidatus Freyarchaeota archaeon]